MHKKLTLKTIVRLITIVALIATLSCNEHVFEVIDKCGSSTVSTGVKVDPLTKADILIIVDNSGSMQEEQQKMIDNFYDPTCPIDVNNVQDQYKNPSQATVDQLAQNCGFIQILAAYENDFRVGVITTDVGECDNRAYSNGPTGWGRKHQKGCLQAPAGGFGDGRKFLQKSDKDIGIKFSNILKNEVGLVGAYVERGLDAAKYFLKGDTGQHSEQCGNDRDSFLRDDAALVMIFLTDEDDCSHIVTDRFKDELISDNCLLTNQSYPGNGELCYNSDTREDLIPVSEYVDYFKQVKGEGRENSVRVAIIAGGLLGDGGAVAGNCYPDANAPSGQCIPALGVSNITTPAGARCSPESVADGPGGRCCLADAGIRYFDLADAFGSSAFKDTICLTDYRQTMVNIARFSARLDSMDLKEVPIDPSAIIVTSKAENEDKITLKRIPDNANPAGEDGWQFVEPKTIRFYGTVVPGPGVDVEILTAGESITSEECQ